MEQKEEFDYANANFGQIARHYFGLSEKDEVHPLLSMLQSVKQENFPFDKIKAGGFFGVYFFRNHPKEVRDVVESFGKYLVGVGQVSLPSVRLYIARLKKIAVDHGDSYVLFKPSQVIDSFAEDSVQENLTVLKGVGLSTTAYLKFLRFLKSRYHNFSSLLNRYHLTPKSIEDYITELQQFSKSIARKITTLNYVYYSKHVKDLSLTDEQVGVIIESLLSAAVGVGNSLRSYLNNKDFLRSLILKGQQGSRRLNGLPYHNHLRALTIISIALATGRRVSEIHTLKWGDVYLKEYDGSEKLFYDVLTTTGSEYFIFKFRVEKKRIPIEIKVSTKILPKAINNLLFYLLDLNRQVFRVYCSILGKNPSKSEIEDAYIFFKFNGTSEEKTGPWGFLSHYTHIWETAKRKYFSRWAEIMGIPLKQFKFHMFRHNFISHLVSKVSVPVAAKMMAINMNTLTVYAHNVEDESRLKLFDKIGLDTEIEVEEKVSVGKKKAIELTSEEEDK